MAQSLAGLAHRFEGVHDQVENNLLQLNAVAVNDWQVFGKVRLEHDAVPQHFAACQLDDLEDRFVDVQPLTSWRHLLDQLSYPTDDIAGANAVLDDGFEGLPRLPQIGG